MALTWQSVSPSNPAGILQASNMAGANIAKGLDVIGSSMQEYAKDTKDAETGKLLLMLDNAKDRNERQTILDNADKSYIDQNVIAKENQQFEAREQQKELEEFNRTMQKDAAARDILAKKTTADFQAETLKNQRSEQQLAKLHRIEDLRLEAKKYDAELLRKKAQDQREISKIGML